MYLPRESAELLESRHSEINLLDPGTKFPFYKHREKELIPFFEMDDHFICCVDVEGLLAAMGCKYDADKCRLFINSSKARLKCVLHNGR